jgi:hypothetical protein
MYMESLVVLEIRPEGNAMQNGEPAVGFPFPDNAPAHRSVLVMDFVSKSNVTTLQHPHTLLTRLLLILTCSLD